MTRPSPPHPRGQLLLRRRHPPARGRARGDGLLPLRVVPPLSAGPVNAFTLWSPAAVRITRGAELIGRFARSPNSVRTWCKACGGHLMTDHPQWGLVDVYAAVIDRLTFTPALHVNYGETVLPLRDGLPKQRDFPADLGGSGQLVAE